MPFHLSRDLQDTKAVIQPPLAATTISPSARASDSVDWGSNHILLLSNQDGVRRSYKDGVRRSYKLHLKSLGYPVTEASDWMNAKAIMAADLSLDIGIVDCESYDPVGELDAEDLTHNRLGKCGLSSPRSISMSPREVEASHKSR